MKKNTGMMNTNSEEELLLVDGGLKGEETEKASNTVALFYFLSWQWFVGTYCCLNCIYILL